jgi:hypothetical protein
MVMAAASHARKQEYNMRNAATIVLACLIPIIISVNTVYAQERTTASKDLTSTIKAKLGSKPLVMQWSMGESSASLAQVNWNLQQVWKMFEDPLTAKQVKIQLLDNTGRPWWNLDESSSRPVGKWTPSVSPIHKDVSAFLKGGRDFRLLITDMTGRQIVHPVTLQMLSSNPEDPTRPTPHEGPPQPTPPPPSDSPTPIPPLPTPPQLP